MNRRTLIGSVLAVSALAVAPAYADFGERFLIAETNTPNPDGDVIDVAAATGQFTRFLALVEQAGYEETLRGEGPFTLFAPTDEAFRRMPAREVERLQTPQAHDELLALLAYHVVADRLTRESIGQRVRRVEAASGYQLEIDARDGLRVNDQLVVMRDIEATNGVIQGVNAVLTPPVLVASR
jgi:uncharacterized surface protein with fasciclin (FAS1) repeats